MSFVNVGAAQSESFTLSVFQSGSSEIDIVLKNDLVPGDTQDWMVGVASLQAPLDSTVFLDENHAVLMNLRRFQDKSEYSPEFYHLFPENVEVSYMMTHAP